MFDNLYENVGSKIKNLAKWVFIVEAISAIIAGICLMCFASDIDDPMFIFGIVAIILGPCVAWVGSWILYAFGELAEDVHAIRCNPSINSIDKNIQLIAEPYAKREAEEKAKREAEAKAKREAEERAKREAEAKAKREAEAKAKREAEEKARREAEEKARREAEEKARREAEAIAKLEAEKRAKQTTQKKEKTLSEELEYALKFQTDDGMVSYLKELQDETVQNILKSPQHLIREQIKNLLEHM